MKGNVQHGAAVNVDLVCGSCALVVGIESWTKDAWLKRKVKP